MLKILPLSGKQRKIAPFQFDTIQQVYSLDGSYVYSQLFL